MTRRRRPRIAGALSVTGAALLLPILVIAGVGVLMPGTQPSDGSGDPAFPPFMDGASPGTFALPRPCGSCHGNYREPGERMHEPYDTWAGSMMAQSARDPLFWAALDIANQDDAALGDAGVGDFCLRCHVPRAWYEGRSKCTTAWGEEFDGSCLDGSPDVASNDFEGVFCSACHRMYDASNPPPNDVADPAAPYVGNAQTYFTVDETWLLGPFPDATPPPNVHDFRHSPFHRTSSFCGQCHDVTHPTRNRRDSVTGADLGFPMPIERTFTEHRQSRFADVASSEHAECQDCHMPPPDLDGDGRTDDAKACGNGVFPLPVRGEATVLEGPLHVHSFAGGNAWMLGVLRDLYGPALNRVAQFDNGIAASLRLLQEQTLEVDLTAPASVQAGGTLDVSIRVTNLAGHKFPTGYPEGRRAFVNVVAGEDLDNDGSLAPSEITFESCAYDSATGDLTVDPQAKIYEAQFGVWDFNGDGQCDTVDDSVSRPMFHFALNDCVVQDNRIPPLGFAPDVETAPIGYGYPPNPALPGTLANWDDSLYSIPVPALTSNPFLVVARVRYQSTSKEYVEFLRDETRSTCDPRDAGCDPTQPVARATRGEKVYDHWAASGRAEPIDLGSASASVAVTPPPGEACCSLGACSEVPAAECLLVEGADPGGPGTNCANTACAPLLIPSEVSDVLDGDAPLLATRDRATGELVVSFDPACDATDHEILWGSMLDVGSHLYAGFSCGLGMSGTTRLDPGAGSWWLVVAGRNDVAEGSYGRDSFGAEHPERVGATPCDEPQVLGATCR